MLDFFFSIIELLLQNYNLNEDVNNNYQDLINKIFMSYNDLINHLFQLQDQILI